MSDFEVAEQVLDRAEGGPAKRYLHRRPLLQIVVLCSEVALLAILALTPLATAGLVATATALLTVLIVGAYLLYRIDIASAAPEYSGLADVGSVLPSRVGLLPYIENLEVDFSSDVIARFTESLVDPTRVRRRITDRYRFSRDSVEISSSIEFDVTSRLAPLPFGSSEKSSRQRNGQRFYLAVDLVDPGLLRDDYRVMDDSGRSLPILTFVETRELLAITIRSLARAALGIDNAGDSRADRPSYLRTNHLYYQILDNALSVLYPYPSDAGYQAIDNHLYELDRLTDDVERFHRGLAQESGDSSASQHLRILRRLVQTVSNQQVTVVAVPAPVPNMLRVILSRSAASVEFVEGARASRGERPTAVGSARALDIPAPGLTTSREYDLTVEAPDEYYVMDASFIGYSGGTRGSGDPLLPQQVKISRRAEQGYLHISWRGAWSRHRVAPTVRILLEEKPPGSVGRASVISAAAAGGVLAVGAISTHIEASPASGTLVLGLIAAVIPGLAAAWHAWQSNRSIWTSRSHAQISAWATTAVVVGAVILLAVQSLGIELGHAYAILGVPVLPAWVILFIVAFTNFASITYHSIIRLAAYRRLSTGELLEEHLGGKVIADSYGSPGDRFAGMQ